MRNRSRCLWREEQFMLHVVQRVISPSLSLKECVEQWDEISFLLREPPRKRTLQTEQMESKGPSLP